MTGTPQAATRFSTSAPLVRELVDRLSEPSKLVVKEELALVAMRLNMEFLACEYLVDVAALASAVYAHNPAIISVVHSAIQEGDACVHILLELLYDLTHCRDARDAMLDAGVLDTLVGVLPALVLTTDGGASCVVLLQLLDAITDDDVRTVSSDRRRRRRLATQRLCRVACVRVLWNVLITDQSSSDRTSSPPGPDAALALLCKITGAIETTMAGSRLPLPAAMQQVITHTLQRTPHVEATLAKMLEDDGDDHGHQDPRRGLLARVQRWRLANKSRSNGAIFTQN